MEIEAKYSVLDPETAQAFMPLTHIAGYQIQADTTRQIHDIYIDTPDQRLMASGYACRGRDNGRALHINIKGLGGSDGTIHRRIEAAVSIDSEALLIPDRWPTGAIRDMVLRLGHNQALCVLFEIHQTRQIRHFIHPERGAVAELSLDDVTFQDKKAQHHATELEIELLAPGTEEDLTQIIAALKAWPGLVPQPTSKFERGMELAHRHEQCGANLDLGDVQKNDTFGEATRKLIRPLFLRMQLHEPGTYKGEDPEELHDMRVMTRRMRTAFRIAEPCLIAEEVKQVRKGLRKTARLLGAVRDMDVFRKKTERIAATAGVPEGEMAPLIDAWNIEYARARNAMLSYLNSPKYSRFKEAFWAMLATQLPEKQPAPHVQDVVRDVITAQLATLLAQGQMIERPQAALSAYHQLRIDVKQLRYTLTFFLELLGPETKPALQALEMLQDYFGDLQDAIVAVNHLRAVTQYGTWQMPLQPSSLWDPPAKGKLTTGLQTLLEMREAEMDGLIAKANKTWYAFKEQNVPDLIQDALRAL